MSDSKTRDVGVHPGDVLAAKYRVTRVLGVGAMGFVVAAHHVQLDTKVAIKLLLPELLQDDQAVARFSREAKAVARLTNEHVARVLDVGELDTGIPYIVMEYLEGEDLAARLQREGPLAIEQAVEFVVQACVAVAEAHALGIVHRDLKPANLFCIRRPDGQLSVKVLDFGISKVMATGAMPDTDRFSITKNLEAIGSPYYMSPEQMKSARHADAQSDVWALGVILYELLAANVPFTGESETDVAIHVASHPPRPLLGFRPEVPPRLEAVILKCLEKDKALRYLTVADLACDLAPFAPTRAWGAIERISETVAQATLAANDIEVELDVDARPEPMPLQAGAGDRHAATVLRAQEPASGRSAGISVGRAAGVAAAILGLAIIGGATVFLVRTTSRPATAAPGMAASPASGASAPIEVAVPPAPPVTESTSAAVPLPAPAPTVSQQDHPTQAPTPAASTVGQPRRKPPAATAPPSCDVPYTLDSEGRKHFRPECFLKDGVSR